MTRARSYKDVTTAAGLPAAAAVELLADPLAVAIARAGCSGYWLIHRVDCSPDVDGALIAAGIRESINAALGVTPPQREAIAAGSMFGWDCPAADPINYDAGGKMLRQISSAGIDEIAPEKPGPSEADCRGW